MAVKLAQAELKALCHFAKTKVLGTASCCTESGWLRHDENPAITNEQRRNRPSAADRERYERIERDDMLGALEVFGVLSGAQLAFSTARGLPEPGEYVYLNFSVKARTWLEESRRELAGALELQRGTVEIEGRTRNDTFALFAFDTIAKQLATMPDLKAAA
jgi:hypothetical protein